MEKSPKVSVIGSNPIDAEYGNPINITCEVIGYPTPDIVWTDINNKAELEAVSFG